MQRVPVAAGLQYLGQQHLVLSDGELFETIDHLAPALGFQPPNRFVCIDKEQMYPFLSRCIFRFSSAERERDTIDVERLVATVFKAKLEIDILCIDIDVR